MWMLASNIHGTFNCVRTSIFVSQFQSMFFAFTAKSCVLGIICVIKN